MFRIFQKNLSKKNQKIDDFVNRGRTKRTLTAIVMCVGFVVILLPPLGTTQTVKATVTKSGLSYRSKASHHIQVELQSGRLVMLELPHNLMLLPGQQLILTQQSPLVFGPSKYYYDSTIKAQ